MKFLRASRFIAMVMVQAAAGSLPAERLPG